MWPNYNCSLTLTLITSFSFFRWIEKHFNGTRKCVLPFGCIYVRLSLYEFVSYKMWIAFMCVCVCADESVHISNDIVNGIRIAISLMLPSNLPLLTDLCLISVELIVSFTNTLPFLVRSIVRPFVSFVCSFCSFYSFCSFCSFRLSTNRY